jgi:hippurate hydrolase
MERDRWVCRVAALALVLGGPLPARAEQTGSARLRSSVERTVPAALALYQWLHAHPELSQQESGTAARLAAELRELGLEVHEGIGGTGVVGILRGGRPGNGPVVLYRADMDALPVLEATGLPYASQNRGVMHACGHDIHMATAVGAMRVLEALKDQWAGTVLFVGQPAEELGLGASAVLADARFRDILRRVGKPRLALALHDTADLPAGAVALVPGHAYANVDSLDITIHGRGGHGAQPHETVDPVVIAAELILSLQTVVSRRLPPGERAVITVGRVEAGSKRNVIPSTALLQLTVRSYGDERRKFLLEEIRRTATAVAQAHGAPRPPRIESAEAPLLSGYNDPGWTERLETAFTAALGTDRVVRQSPATWGEDFGNYARALGVPGVLWTLGAASARPSGRGKAVPGLHSDRFAPDAKPTLRTGIHTAVTAVLTGLAPARR